MHMYIPVFILHRQQKAHFLDDDKNPDFSLQISPTPSPQAMNGRIKKVE